MTMADRASVFVEPLVNGGVGLGEPERDYLESLIRVGYERCHPGDTFDDLKARARFSREDKGLLRDWMTEAGRRAGSGRLANQRARIPSPRE